MSKEERHDDVLWFACILSTIGKQHLLCSISVSKILNYKQYLLCSSSVSKILNYLMHTATSVIAPIVPDLTSQKVVAKFYSALPCMFHNIDTSKQYNLRGRFLLEMHFMLSLSLTPITNRNSNTSKIQYFPFNRVLYMH